MSLNPAQQEAIRHFKGPAMVLAGPGSGKTLVLTHRVRQLIEEYRVPPQEILVITFTRAAAKEMEERFVRLMNGEKLPVTFGTFHAVFFHILKAAYRFTGANILRQEQQDAILKELARGHAQQEETSDREWLKELAGEIGRVKGSRVKLSDYYAQCCPAEEFREIYTGYERKLGELSLIDFEDMMKLCYELFTARPDILAGWRKRYRYFLIDEFQDINLMQYEIVRMMAAPLDNLFIVGDDDQSIYRFRGAMPEIMLNFPKDYPDCHRVLLDVNYRSTPEIVNTAGRLIAQNTARYRKKLRAGMADEGRTYPPVEVKAFPTLAEENDGTLRKLQEYHRQGIPYEEMALLYRTRQAPRAMAESLMRSGLPFCMADVIPNLFEHWITGDIVTYMMIAAGSRRRADFLRVINRPKRYISRNAFPDPEVSMEALKEGCGEKDWMIDRLDRLEYELKMLARMRPAAAVHYIRQGMEYDSFLKEYAAARNMQPDELLDTADELEENAGHFQTLPEWISHMRRVTRELKEKKNEKRGERKGITVATMHGAKGLEYRVVFVMDANEGMTPHKKATLPADIEEERRLFYVALTRAKTYLHVYYARERFQRELPASRFVREMGVAEKRVGSRRAKSSKSVRSR